MSNVLSECMCAYTLSIGVHNLYIKDNFGIDKPILLNNIIYKKKQLFYFSLSGDILFVCC